MAINFYSSLSLNKNELQNAVVQNAGSDPGSAVAGQIYYNSGDNTLRFHNGSSFQTLSTTTGDITGVTSENSDKSIAKETVPPVPPPDKPAPAVTPDISPIGLQPELSLKNKALPFAWEL